MDEKIRKRLEEEYLKILHKKLELIFNFNPKEEEKKVNIKRKKRDIKVDEPVFDIKTEYWGPHEDFTKIVLYDGDRRLDEGNDFDDIYPIGRGLFVATHFETDKEDDYREIKSIFDKDRKIVYRDISRIANAPILIKKFCGGFAIIRIGYGKFNVIDSNFNCISTVDFMSCKRLTEKLFLVKVKNGYNVIDTSGNFLFKKNSIREDDIVLNDCFISSKNEIIPLVKEYEKYTVKKKIMQTKYTCKSKEDSFEVKYYPLRIYGNRYCLCLNNQNKKIYMYDRFIDKYIELDDYSSIRYSKKHDFIFTKYSVYFIYNDKLLDISQFYSLHFSDFNDKNGFSIRKGITGALSYEDFKFENMLETERIIQEEIENYKKQEERIKQEEEKKNIERAKQNSKRQEEEKKNRKVELLLQLKEIIEAIDTECGNQETIERIHVHNIFIKVKDHLEINPIYLDILKYIDLSLFPFINVKMSNIDCRDTNIGFDPQMVYQKDLRNSNFEGIYIGPFMNFNGVNIIGCKFSDDKNPNTDDYLNHTFKNAIFDETTTYNGIPITEFIKNRTR